MKTLVAGEVVAINDAVAGKPGTINKDPYIQGWVVKIKPASWDADASALKTGAGALAAESGSPPLARECA